MDDLLELPYEILINEFATKFYVTDLLSFCKVDKRAAKICKDILFWQIYVRDMDHRDFQDLMILLATKGEERIFIKLVNNSAKLLQIIDKRTFLWAYFNFAMYAATTSVNPEDYYNVLNYILDHDEGIELTVDVDADNIEFLGKLRDYNPSPKVIVEKMRKMNKIVHKIGKGKIISSSKINKLHEALKSFFFSFYSQSYFFEYLVNTLSKEQYNWLVEYNGEGGLADYYFFIPALLNINDIDTVSNIINYYYSYPISDDIWRTVSSFGSLDQIFVLYNEIHPSAIPFGKYENLFYYLASKGSRLIIYGCHSTNPKEYINFLNKLKLGKEKNELIQQAIDYGRENGYTYWSNFIENYLYNLEKVV